MNPYEALLAANSAYHNAIGEILLIQTDVIPIEKRVELKVHIGASANTIFQLMNQINEKLKPYFEEDE
jgi:hypothetical protein